jgi:hypothetical protein
MSVEEGSSFPLVISPESFPDFFYSIFDYSRITYYWTVPLILDHPYFVGKLKSSKIADAKVSGF